MADKPNIHQRLVAASKEIGHIDKEATKAGFKAVSHDKVTDAIRGPLLNAGVLAAPLSMERTQNGNRTEVDMVVRFANSDNPEDYIDVPSFGYGIDSRDKGPGMAISYAFKYACLKVLSLRTGEDTDFPAEATPEHKPTPTGPTEEEKAATRMRFANDLANALREEENIGKRADLIAGKLEKIKKLKEGDADAYGVITAACKETRTHLETEDGK